MGKDNIMERSNNGKISELLLPDKTVVQSYLEKQELPGYNSFSLNIDIQTLDIIHPFESGNQTAQSVANNHHRERGKGNLLTIYRNGKFIMLVMKFYASYIVNPLERRNCTNRNLSQELLDKWV